MDTDRIICPPTSKIRYRCVIARHWLDSGRTSPVILVFNIFDEHIPRDLRSRVIFDRYWVDGAAGEHIVQIYRNRVLFSRHHFYHFKDSGVPVSINGGENTSKIARTFFSVSRIFFQYWLYYYLPPTCCAGKTINLLLRWKKSTKPLESKMRQISLGINQSCFNCPF